MQAINKDKGIVTQQPAQRRNGRQKAADWVFSFAGILVAVSVVIEVISWLAGFDYPFMANLAYPTFVAMLACAMAPLYFMRTGATAAAASSAARGQPEVVTTWQNAEISARNFMRANGFPDARLTPPGPDGGVDVVSAGAIAQVKFYATAIGEPAVVQLAGTTMKPEFRGRRALFFASSGFTPKALKTAEDLGVALFVLRGGRRWVRVQ